MRERESEAELALKWFFYVLADLLHIDVLLMKCEALLKALVSEEQSPVELRGGGAERRWRRL